MSIKILLVCLVSSLAIISSTASAEPTTFRISQVYSNLDGSLQYVELTEMEGLDGQHRLAGLTLTITSGGVEKQYVFPHDLQTEQTAHLSIVVAASAYHHLPIGNFFGGGYNCCYLPTFATLPLRFLPTSGGTLDFAGIDRVTYAGLPTDGTNALYREGPVRGATVRGGRCYIGAGCASRFHIAQSYILAVEYYAAARDHYFLTALADEIDAIDAGRRSGWQRTGEMVYIGGGRDTYPGLDQPVCRYYIPPELGDSHVLSASAEECAEIGVRFPRLLLETPAAFHVAAPDPESGLCARNLDWNAFDYLRPLYRLWNQRADSNHRYTMSKAIRDDMISRGYVAEGYGPEGVAMCVP